MSDDNTKDGKIKSREIGIYLIKLWLLSTGVIAPVILALLAISENSSYLVQNSGAGVILLFSPFGLLFSLPTLLITGLLSMVFESKIPSDITLKIIIDSVVIAGIFITIHTIGFNESANTYILAYTAGVVITSIFIPLRKAVR